MEKMIVSGFFFGYFPLKRLRGNPGPHHSAGISFCFSVRCRTSANSLRRTRRSCPIFFIIPACEAELTTNPAGPYYCFLADIRINVLHVRIVDYFFPDASMQYQWLPIFSFRYYFSGSSGKRYNLKNRKSWMYMQSGFTAWHLSEWSIKCFDVLVVFDIGYLLVLFSNLFQ